MLSNLADILAPFGITAPAMTVGELVLDSRQVGLHTVFVALPGHQRDGRDFIPQAISLGAKVILVHTDVSDEHGQISMREHSMLISFYQLAEKLSELAGHCYLHPSSHLQIVAVTGTNGKTSTVQLCAQLSQLCGTQAGTIGTLGVGMLGATEASINTTPDAISIQRHLALMSQQGARLVAMEASSHALVQQRMAAINVDVAVFTNLTRDHLDYHGSMAAYAAAKRKLINQPGLKFMLLNQHDSQSQQWLAECPDTVTAVLFGIGQPVNPEMPYCVAKNIDYLADGMVIDIDSSFGQGQLRCSLLGEFNVMNLLAALTSQLCLGVPMAQLCQVAPQLVAIAGRMEVFQIPQHAPVVVDYAHTPDALKQALLALRNHCQGKLWCLFGCGGDRDKGKRPVMGEMAERYADVVWITNDNSRSEQPEQIARDILTGCQHPERIEIELDRKTAISRMLEQADANDMILLAGKGHEDYQIIGDTRLPYDERKYVQQLLERITP